LLEQPPQAQGLLRTRWRLSDIGQCISWLSHCTAAGVWHQLRSFQLTHKLAERFMRSPDPDYDRKWRAVLGAYTDVIAHPQQAVLLFGDELTYYRRPTLKRLWQRRGQRVRRNVEQRPAPNTKTRLAAAVDATSGRLCYEQRSKIGRQALCRLLRTLRSAYPQAERLYLVWDNWPTHRHAEVVQAAVAQRITLLFLPTYASWLNPIERLWRWLRSDLLHNHEQSAALQRLRAQVRTWLDQFTQPAPHLLYRIGLLSKPELEELCLLIC
jgi:transposase